jgi:hypothetical protein
MKAKFLKIYQSKDKSLSIHVGIDLHYWGIPFYVRSVPVVSAFGIHLLQLMFLCFFIEVEWLELES